MTESNTAIKLTGVKKQYKLGQIGGGTLQGDQVRKRGGHAVNGHAGQGAPEGNDAESVRRGGSQAQEAPPCGINGHSEDQVR